MLRRIHTFVCIIRKGKILNMLKKHITVNQIPFFVSLRNQTIILFLFLWKYILSKFLPKQFGRPCYIILVILYFSQVKSCLVILIKLFNNKLFTYIEQYYCY